MWRKKMNIKYELENTEKEPKIYTKKLVDYHVNNHTLTKQEYKQELLSCEISKKIDQTIIETISQRFEFKLLIDERRYEGVLVLTPYEIYFIGYGLFYQKPASEKIFLETDFLYTMYEHVYKDPTKRIKLMYEMGPKLSLDEFKKRHDSWKKTMSI